MGMPKEAGTGKKSKNKACTQTAAAAASDIQIEEVIEKTKEEMEESERNRKEIAFACVPSKFAAWMKEEALKMAALDVGKRRWSDMDQETSDDEFDTDEGNSLAGTTCGKT